MSVCADAVVGNELSVVRCTFRKDAFQRTPPSPGSASLGLGLPQRHDTQHNGEHVDYATLVFVGCVAYHSQLGSIDDGN